jgi:flagellar hook-associated protein 1 FlgK
MGGLTGALNISLGSLQVDEDAIATSANNVANADTPGYSRQIANLAETAPITIGNIQFGTGVTLQSVTSTRDSILDLRVNQETQLQGQLNAFISDGQQIQSLFNETGGTGLQAPLTAFFTSLSQLSANPSDTNTRQGVLTAADNLATAFNQTSANLSSLQSTTNLGVTQTVSQINTLTTQLATLNTQIASSTGAGQNPGPLVDQRQLLLNQLSNLVDVSEINAGNGNLTLTTSTGAPLVVGGQSFALTTQVNATTGQQDVYSQGTDITTQIASGQLAGQIQIRDQEIPALQNSLDTLAFNFANAVNTQNAAGFDLNGNAGGNFFTPPATVAGAAAGLSVAITDPTLIAASQDGQSGDNANANALLALQNQNIVSGQTPLNYYSGIVFKIGNDVSSAQASEQSGSAVLQQIQNLQGGVSNVDQNEEAGNLVQFQSAYEASAEVATTVNTLLQDTINIIAL